MILMGRWFADTRLCCNAPYTMITLHQIPPALSHKQEGNIRQIASGDKQTYYVQLFHTKSTCDYKQRLNDEKLALS